MQGCGMRRHMSFYLWHLDDDGRATFWQSKCQDVVALSTTESSMVLAKGAQQARWIHNFLSEVGPLPSTLKADNKGAIAISENPKFHSRVKHIDI